MDFNSFDRAINDTDHDLIDPEEKIRNTLSSGHGTP